MKKFLSLAIAVIMTMSCPAACGSGAEPDAEAGGTGDGKKGISIVTTIFPEYDWVNNILGDNPANAEVTMLLENGVDLHSYQPAVEDIMKISTCDMFIYVGGESSEWVEDALQEAKNKDMVVIRLLDELGDRVKEEEVAEGMEAEKDEEGEGEDKEAPEYDEHVWLSLKNASYLVNTLSEAIQSIDPDNAEIYRSNAEAYTGRLDELDREYESAVSEAKVKTLLFGDRFPFRYLTDDYGLKYYAAFAGCSAETEASFETITFLAQKVDELSLHSVMTIEGQDHRIAETIVDNTGSRDQRILTMDSMQSITSDDAQNGISYLSVMESNLGVLKEALKQ